MDPREVMLVTTPYLLVDDRDGRVLAEVWDPVEAFRLVDQLEQDYPQFADALCLVRFDARRGALLGVETTTRVRSLS